MRKVSGIALSILLGLVIFLPLISLPIIGSYNASKLQEEGAPSIVIEILALAAIGVVASLLEKPAIIRIVGVIAGADVAYNYFRVSNYVNNNALSKELIQFEYGWYIWAAVAIGLFAISFIEDEKSMVKLTKKCKYCYEDIDTNASVCKYCGKEQKSMVNSNSNLVAILNNDGSWVCPKCGKKNESDYTRCENCLWENKTENIPGKEDLEKPRIVIEVDKEVAAKRNEIWKCAKCGYDQNKGTYTKCLKCSEIRSV